jgi:Raf kinase inhibitor-like YbhB/YbcL family protein
MAPGTNQFRLSTDAIDGRGYFDPRYTCDMDNSSPELRWMNPPEKAVGFALIALDLDAHNGPFTHWVVYNIPANIHHLPAGIPPQESLPNGIKQGINSYGKLGYSGPCPPSRDQAHRYIFRLYALTEHPQLPSRANSEQLIAAVANLTLDRLEIAGLYQRLTQKAG